MFGACGVPKSDKSKPDASVYMLDRFVKRAMCVVMFWKARVEEEDVEAYFHGLVKKCDGKFKVVASKMAKLERVMKQDVFRPSSLK